MEPTVNNVLDLTCIECRAFKHLLSFVSMELDQSTRTYDTTPNWDRDKLHKLTGHNDALNKVRREIEWLLKKAGNV